MTEIEKAAQEAWKLCTDRTTPRGCFIDGFRAGAEWRDKQQPDKTEALEALERLAKIPGVSATDLRPIRQFIERHALTSEQEVPEGWQPASEPPSTSREVVAISNYGDVFILSYLRPGGWERASRFNEGEEVAWWAEPPH